MIGTFAYLILTSVRNQLRGRVARLRNPRYAIALAVGLTYLWFVYLRPSADRPHAEDVIGGTVALLLPLLLLAFIAWTWLSGGDRTALAFSPAEVTLLFTAPVSRRALVLYKIARTQVRILVTSLIWTLIFRQTGSGTTAVLHALSYWVLLSIINMNRLGVALVHANGAVHGLRAARRSWIPVGVVVAIVAMVLASVAAAWPAVVQADGPGAMAAAVAGALTRRPASLALLPFRLALAPLEATPGLAWLRAMAPALLLLAGMTAWVLGTDAAFEETAAEASAAQARRLEARRARRMTSTGVRSARGSIALRPTGIPAVALLWKNALWLRRSGMLRGLLVAPAIGVVCVVVLAPRSENLAVAITAVSAIIASILLLVGPMTLRNDLRSELLHLSVLKTLPLRGRDVVLAEVASSALPLAFAQYLMLLVALRALGFTGITPFPPGVGLSLALGILPVLVGLNGVVSMIHNGLALLFPGWVRLGAQEGGGIETLGLGMMNVAISLTMLGVMMLVPGTVLALTLAAGRAQLALALLIGALLAAALLLAECVLCAWSLGGTLERVEPLQVEG